MHIEICAHIEAHVETHTRTEQSQSKDLNAYLFADFSSACQVLNFLFGGGESCLMRFKTSKPRSRGGKEATETQEFDCLDLELNIIRLNEDKCQGLGFFFFF